MSFFEALVLNRGKRILNLEPEILNFFSFSVPY